MSAALKAAGRAAIVPREKPDRRRHFRVDLDLGGRFLLDEADHSLITRNVSCGGALLSAQILPPEGQAIVCYFDDLGRVAARVVRHVEDGFAVTFESSAHKRDKLADRLVWLVNHKKFELQDERAAPRKAAGGPALVTRANGSKLQCRVIDISLTGAAFEYKGAAPFVGEIVRAGSLKGEVVRSVSNEFAIHFLHKRKSDPDNSVT